MCFYLFITLKWNTFAVNSQTIWLVHCRRREQSLLIYLLIYLIVRDGLHSASSIVENWTHYRWLLISSNLWMTITYLNPQIHIYIVYMNWLFVWNIFINVAILIYNFYACIIIFPIMYKLLFIFRDQPMIDDLLLAYILECWLLNIWIGEYILTCIHVVNGLRLDQCDPT